MPTPKSAKFFVSIVAALALAFSGLTGLQAASAAGDVNVNVQDSTTATGIAGAFVSVIATAPADSDGDGLNDVDAGSVVVGGPTDSNGDFSPTKTDLSALDDATYGVVVSATGYQSAAGTLVVSGSTGSVTVQLTANASSNLKPVPAFGASVVAVANDGRSGTFYALTAGVPGLFRSTDYAGSWSPTALLRDEAVEAQASDGLQGLNSSAKLSNLVTSGYPGEVAVTVGQTEWYSRDFGSNWHSFALPAGTWDTITWSHAHAADTSDHVSLMTFTSANTVDMGYAFMPTGIAGSGIGAAGKVEPNFSTKVLSGTASFKLAATDLVATAAGASSVFIAVQSGANGTNLYEVAPGANAITRVGAHPTQIAGLTRDTTGSAGPNGLRDLLLFGGQANIDGTPSSILIYDRSVVGGVNVANVSAASLYPDANGVDKWVVASTLWARQADGTLVAANTAIGDPSPSSNVPNCGEDATSPVGDLAPMFAGVGNLDLWSNAATTAVVRSCEFTALGDASTINGTDVPAGSVIVSGVAGIAPSTSAVFDANFDFGQSNEVMITGAKNYGVAKSATWFAGNIDGSIMNVDATTYDYQPLFPIVGSNADAFIQNQAQTGTDITSGGFSFKGMTSPKVNDIAMDPTDPSSHVIALGGLGGNRTVMSVDNGASYFTVGAGATAATWWVDASGQNWIANGSTSNPASILAVRQFSSDDLANTQADVTQFGLSPDDPNYLGTRLNLSDPFVSLGTTQFKVAALSDPQVLAMQGIADTTSMLVAVGGGSSSSLALVNLAGDPGAETLGTIKYLTAAGQWTGTLAAPSYSGLTVTSLQYCPAGSAASVADKAFVSLADTTGNATGGVRVISGLRNGAPVITTAAASGLSLGTSDNIRDLKVDCDSGLIAVASRGANGAASPASPLVFVSKDAGATFKALTKSATETLTPTMSDIESLAIKSDPVAGTFDVLATTLNGDVLTVQQKIADLAKASISSIYKVVNDSTTQVTSVLSGVAGGDAEFTPSDTSVANYIAQTASLNTPPSQAAVSFVGLGAGAFIANLAGASAPVLKTSDAISVTAAVGGAAATTWTSAITLPMDKTATIAATSTSRLPVSIATSSPCSLNGSVLSSSAASGTCTVTFTTAGDNTYAAASETRTVNLAAATPKSNDTISVTSKSGTDSAVAWTGSSLTLKNGNAVTVTATATSGLSVAIALASGNCTLVGSTLTAKSASGTCQLTFTTAGNATYNAASESRTANLTNKPDTLTVTIAVGDAPNAAGAVAQTVAVGQPTLVKYGQVAVVAATTTSQASVSVTSSANCSISGSTVTPLTGTGSCVLSFSTTSINGWDAIAETRTLNLALATDTLTVTANAGAGAQVWGASHLGLVFAGQLTAAVSSASGNAVVSSISGPCTMSNMVVTATAGSGSCTLTLSTTASAKYSSVVATRVIDLSKAPDAITISATPDNGTKAEWPQGTPLSLKYQAGITVAATSTSGSAVALSVTGNCSLTNGRILATSGTGSCTLTASTTAGANYAAGSTTRTVNLQKLTDAISATLSVAGGTAAAWTTNQPIVRLDQTAAVMVSTTSGKSVNLVANGGCTIAGGVITPSAATGTCTITAATTDDANYGAATQTWTLVLAARPVVKDTLAITYAIKSLGDASFAQPLAWNAAAITFEYADVVQIGTTTKSGTAPQITVTGSCTLSGNLLTVTKGSGACLLTAVVANSAGYTGLTVKRTANAIPATVQAPTLAAMAIGGKQTLIKTISIGTYKAALTYTVAPASSAICSISGTTLTAKKKGNCSIAIGMLAMGGYYNAIATTVTVKVG